VSFTAVDFASRQIPAQAIKDAGHSAVVAYVSPSRPGSNFGAKPLTRLYADQLKNAGLQVVSNWQYGKPGGSAPSDWTTGFQGGVAQAQQAEANHVAAGGDESAPIFFSVDEGISLGQWNDTAVEYFRGINSVLGVQRTGVYGSSLVASWAIQDGVIGRSTTPGKYWVWQTRSWSNGEIEAGAVLYQNVIDTASSPGPQIDGTAVDVSDIQAEDFGQWGYNREVVVSIRPDFVELQQFGDSHSSRNGAFVSNGLLHTQEGNGTAQSLANYLNNPNNDASYHDVLRDGVLINVVPLDRASWSVLSANPYTYNLCFAGSRAAWSREEWLSIDRDLRIAAYIMVERAKVFGFAADVIAPPYRVAQGISDHKYVTQALGIGTHTDVGLNFPWDVFAGYVDEYRNPAPAGPKYNAIDDVAAQNPWLGARLTDGEITPPDGKGRFAGFEKGNVYWSPSTHAHPVPLEVMTVWASQKWETGPLGYPVTDPTMDNAGIIQGFEGGAIFKKTGFATGFIIQGDIRDRWVKSGAEKGALGWPISNEWPWDNGVVQDFEHGRLFWVPKSTTIALLDNNNPL